MTTETFVLKIADPKEVIFLIEASIDTVERLCVQHGSQIDLDPLRDLAAQIEAQVTP